MKLRSIALKVFLAVSTTLLLVAATLACVMEFPHYKVSRSFGVKVSFRNSPLAGVAVKITDIKPDESGKYTVQEVTSGVSDEHGKVAFAGLAPGRYSISARQAGVESFDSGYLQVVDDEPDGIAEDMAVDTVNLSWSDKSFEPVQRVGGTFSIYPSQDQRNFRSQRKIPLAGASVSVVDFISGREQGVTATDILGALALPTLNPGYYVVRVKDNNSTGNPNWIVNGHVLVRVAPEARRADLSALLIMTDCGLMFDFGGAGNPLVPHGSR